MTRIGWLLGWLLWAIGAFMALPAAAAPPAPADVVRAITAGTDPATLAVAMDADDPTALNATRLALKAAGHPEDAARLLEALAAHRRSDAVLYNLSLAYVDQLPGHNLLRKGFLSTASVRVIDEILKRRPEDWLALHIRGLNNLYWPDWFGRAATAQVDLAHAVQAGQSRLIDHADEDGLAWTYLALGDSLALLDRPAEARAAWQAGRRDYPEFVAFPDRLAVGAAELHTAVRKARDSDQLIDTDLTHLADASGPAHVVTLVGGTLFGPGPLEDQPLRPGGLVGLQLARPFMGTIPTFNNGAGEPHMPGEIAVGKPLNGLFSDATPVNKNVDVGSVVLMNGRFKLFLAAVEGGPNQGHIHFYLDRFWNWTIQDDIGIDPGFAEGVIKFENFTFSTSPRLLPLSTQSQSHEPAGVDRAGSLRSGDIVSGLLGDDGESGKLTGTFNAIGSFPLDSVFLPGAPFAQTRIFESDIAISQEVAGFLTLANAVSHLRAAVAVDPAGPDAERLTRMFRQRLAVAGRHFAKATAWLAALDDDTRAAYARLTAPPDALTERSTKLHFVCDADRDMAVLAARLALAHSERDGSHLAELVVCDKS